MNPCLSHRSLHMAAALLQRFLWPLSSVSEIASHPRLCRAMGIITTDQECSHGTGAMRAVEPTTEFILLLTQWRGRVFANGVSGPYRAEWYAQSYIEIKMFLSVDMENYYR